MSYADQIFIQNCNDILEHGVWDTDHEVRPKWEDGTPAHTIKRFGLVNRYDLTKEFPVITLRRTAFKSAVDELLKREPYPGPSLVMDEAVTDFYQFTTDSFRLEHYQYHTFSEKIPVAI